MNWPLSACTCHGAPHRTLACNLAATASLVVEGGKGAGAGKVAAAGGHHHRGTRIADPESGTRFLLMALLFFEAILFGARSISTRVRMC